MTEAPLYFQATHADSASIRAVADQCAATGFEAIILSFGSGFDPSSTNASYIARIAVALAVGSRWIRPADGEVDALMCGGLPAGERRQIVEARCQRTQDGAALAVETGCVLSFVNNVEKVYKWDGARFAEFQSIPTSGAYDWEAFAIGAVP